jgi:hypothetical protein
LLPTSGETMRAWDTYRTPIKTRKYRLVAKYMKEFLFS